MCGSPTTQAGCKRVGSRICYALGGFHRLRLVGAFVDAHWTVDFCFARVGAKDQTAGMTPVGAGSDICRRLFDRQLSNSNKVAAMETIAHDSCFERGNTNTLMLPSPPKNGVISLFESYILFETTTVWVLSEADDGKN